jgi:DNA-binding SARP family transcriptional activator
VHFSILGPLEASRADEPIQLGGPRQQTVLAMLLLEADQLVPVYRLIDAVWDEDPPPTAREQIHICISSLRRAISPADNADLISTRSPGYLLRLEECTLDERIFEARAQEGRSALSAADPAGAATSLRSALSLWRGHALSSIGSALVQRSVTHLNERRLSVLEECIEIELAAGLGLEPVSELIVLTQENPLRERFSALLMMALSRTGRQADALETYRIARSFLMDQVGIEPGADLQRLQRMILAGQAIVAPAGPPARAAGHGAAQAQGHGTALALAERPSPAIPMLLPPAIPDLTGRSGLMDQIAARMTEAGGAAQALPVTVLHGQGGVGKTAVAIRLAHRLAARFPDGQLFARLQSGAGPAAASDVLRRFLRTLGVSGAALPDSGEERAEVYRNLLAGRRILIVLDNAMSEEQIAPLLPGSAPCSVLVTSRGRLSGLPVTGRFEIGALSRRSAVAMLSAIVGAERIEAQPDAAAALCELCGDLPLALRIVAARLAARPHWRVATLVHRLSDESRWLDELSYGEMGLRASIALSHDALSPEARRLFRLLVLCEAPSFSSWIGSPLVQAGLLRTENLLEELTEAYLLTVEPKIALEPIRYRFHDLVQPFARERLLALESPHELRAVLDRLDRAALGAEYRAPVLLRHPRA